MLGCFIYPKRRDYTNMRTLDDLVADYLLSHELAPESELYYRRMAHVLKAWARRSVTVEAFTPTLVNQMLADKQRSGLSSHYRRSLRNSMRALLGHKYGGNLPDKLRPVRLSPLNPQSWTAAEVQRLIVACEYMRDPRRRMWWQTIIAVGYFTGLSLQDLWRLRLDDIDDRGIVRMERSKTGKPVAMRVPEPWLSQARALAIDGQVFKPFSAYEIFRQTFRRVVKKAGLVGSFKKLRKSCGTSVEQRFPGQGHIALANGRKVFETHYLSRRHFDENPPEPDALP